MMAAGRAVQCGERAVLIERNECFGKKLLVTGKGRCNLTNLEEDPRKFAGVFGKNGKFLLSALSRFGVKDTIKFFEDRGVKTKVERGGRVFPVSDEAMDIRKTLEDYINKGHVTVLKNSVVEDIVLAGGKISHIVLKNGEEVFADRFVIATGGLSYPAIGSKGDGFVWAKKLGHTVVPPCPALVSVEERKQLAHLLKGFRLTVARLESIEKAIVTSGGIALNEVAPQTMQSRIIPNLYFAGEVLDLDGPTGGYNLQVCWSTGFAAGTVDCVD